MMEEGVRNLNAIEMVKSLRARMTNQVALGIPGFEFSGRETPVVQYALDRRTSEIWYESSKRRLLSQFGKGYFPVFRFSDGECYFCLGYRIPPPPPGHSAPVHYVRTALSAYVKYRCHRVFWSGQPGYGHEVYRGKQWSRLRFEFSTLLREIAECGVIAANFASHRGFESMSRYVPDIFDWFDSHEIHLNSENYIPFYFIYAMLLGPEGHKFLRNRRVLVITNLTSEKETRLRAYFEAESVAEVQFIGISRSSSMTDRIHLREEHDGTDLVLVGAGVGAANILAQVRPLHTLSIDAGFVLECYQNPAYRGSRVFTLSDDEIEANKTANGGCAVQMAE
jgi:hypothetical protein